MSSTTTNMDCDELQFVQSRIGTREILRTEIVSVQQQAELKVKHPASYNSSVWKPLSGNKVERLDLMDVDEDFHSSHHYNLTSDMVQHPHEIRLPSEDDLMREEFVFAQRNPVVPVRASVRGRLKNKGMDTVVLTVVDESKPLISWKSIADLFSPDPKTNGKTLRAERVLYTPTRLADDRWMEGAFFCVTAPKERKVSMVDTTDDHKSSRVQFNCNPEVIKVATTRRHLPSAVDFVMKHTALPIVKYVRSLDGRDSRASEERAAVLDKIDSTLSMKLFELWSLEEDRELTFLPFDEAEKAITLRVTGEEDKKEPRDPLFLPVDTHRQFYFKHSKTEAFALACEGQDILEEKRISRKKKVDEDKLQHWYWWWEHEHGLRDVEQKVLDESMELHHYRDGWSSNNEYIQVLYDTWMRKKVDNKSAGTAMTHFWRQYQFIQRELIATGGMCERLRQIKADREFYDVGDDSDDEDLNHEDYKSRNDKSIIRSAGLDTSNAEKGIVCPANYKGWAKKKTQSAFALLRNQLAATRGRRVDSVREIIGEVEDADAHDYSSFDEEKQTTQFILSVSGFFLGTHIDEKMHIAHIIHGYATAEEKKTKKKSKNKPTRKQSLFIAKVSEYFTDLSQGSGIDDTARAVNIVHALMTQNLQHHVGRHVRLSSQTRVLRAQLLLLDPKGRIRLDTMTSFNPLCDPHDRLALVFDRCGAQVDLKEVMKEIVPTGYAFNREITGEQDGKSIMQIFCEGSAYVQALADTITFDYHVDYFMCKSQLAIKTTAMDGLVKNGRTRELKQLVIGVNASVLTRINPVSFSDIADAKTRQLSYMASTQSRLYCNDLYDLMEATFNIATRSMTTGDCMARILEPVLSREAEYCCPSVALFFEGKEPEGWKALRDAAAVALARVEELDRAAEKEEKKQIEEAEKVWEIEEEKKAKKKGKVADLSMPMEYNQADETDAEVYAKPFADSMSFVEDIKMFDADNATAFVPRWKKPLTKDEQIVDNRIRAVRARKRRRTAAGAAPEEEVTTTTTTVTVTTTTTTTKTIKRKRVVAEDDD